MRLQRLALSLTLLLLGALMAALVAIDYQRVRKNETDRLATQSALVAGNLQLQMRSIDRVLDETLALLDFATADQQLDRLHSLVNAMPIIRGIGVLDSQGQRLIGTRPSQTLDFSSRPYFRNAQANPQRQRLYVSTPFKGITGNISIGLSKAVLDRHNAFQGVVFAVLDADHIEILMGATLYTPDMWASLLHIDAGDAVRVGASGWIGGQGAVTSEDLQAQLPNLSTAGRAAFIRDNAPHAPQIVVASTISGYAMNADRPLMVITGRNYDEAMAAWRRSAYLQAALFALFSLAAVAGLLFYQRRRLQYEARRIADQQRVQARENDYRIIVEQTVDCVVKIDSHGNLSYVNPAFCARFGLTPQQAEGESFMHHVVEADRQQARQALAEALEHETGHPLQARFITPNETRHMEWTLCPVSRSDDTQGSMIAVGHDVSAHIAMRDELRSKAEHDSLTGLINRGRFVELATSEVNRSHRYGAALSIMLVDLDHFKSVNDTRGHHAGDAALQTCARVLQVQSREFDIPARIGGEEFIVLLPETGSEMAARVAERIRVAIAEQSVALTDGEHFHIAASLGVATLLPGEDLSGLMKRSDTALYAAKQKGRNRVEISGGA